MRGLAGRHAVPDEAHDGTNDERQGHRHRVPCTPHIRRRRNDDPPGISAQTGAARVCLVDEANLPQAVDGGKDETSSGGVDATESRLDPRPRSKRIPDAHRTVDEDKARAKDANESHQSPRCTIQTRIDRHERTKKDGDCRGGSENDKQEEPSPHGLTVEVGPGKGLDDGQTQEKVTR